MTSATDQAGPGVPGLGDSLIGSGMAHTSAVDSGWIIISTVAVAAALVAFSTVGLVRRPRRPVRWRVAAVEGWFVLQCVSGRPHRVKITFDSEDRRHTWGTVHHEMLHAGDVVKLGPIVQFSDGGRGEHLTVTWSAGHRTESWAAPVG
jgi:hypothetical protein